MGMAPETDDLRAALILTESRPCPICGSVDDTRVYAERSIDPSKLDGFAFASRKMPEYMHHRLVLCPDCALVYASPIPRQGALGKAYEEADFDSGVESRFAARTAAAYLRRFVDRLPDLDGALDIGAGDGAFLDELLDMGWANVIGVEPSTAPIESASTRVRPFLRQALFSAEDYRVSAYSLVTCFQVIEHVPDPLDLVRGAMSLLKPGGAFLMISHDREALSARILGTRSPIFDLEHLQLFSTTSAHRLFADAGLVDIQGFDVVNRYPLHYYLKLLPIPNALKLRLLASARRSTIGGMAIPAPLGNLGVIGYKPR